ncbi:MAG: dolichyl-diphosphooligosaccharide---protein glycosyltransferase, partial [Thermoanaerobaculia bacterium]|nr:dolichyl-diphosphooligosaccharide---protein glycosyltransferase [Thermoanaerobaculia bacterium]
MAREKNGSGVWGVGSGSNGAPSPRDGSLSLTPRARHPNSDELSFRDGSSSPTPHSPLPTPLLGIAFFVLALACRLLNAPYAFEGGKPRIAPVDELYHWKRMAYSAAHFPRVMELDRDRGVGGAFCPWPPLYDVVGGGAARLLGANSSNEVLSRIIWFPPILFALFTGIAVFILARRNGMIV